MSVELSPELVALSLSNLPAAPRTGLRVPERLVEPRSSAANLLVAEFVQRFDLLSGGLSGAALLGGGGGGGGV